METGSNNPLSIIDPTLQQVNNVIIPATPLTYNQLTIVDDNLEQTSQILNIEATGDVCPDTPSADIPIATNHNDLANLQGGNTFQRYHLSQGIYAALLAHNPTLSNPVATKAQIDAAVAGLPGSILNQTGTSQVANFWINGQGKAAVFRTNSLISENAASPGQSTVVFPNAINSVNLDSSGFSINSGQLLMNDTTRFFSITLDGTDNKTKVTSNGVLQLEGTSIKASAAPVASTDIVRLQELNTLDSLKENISNKTNTISNSDTLYPSVGAVQDYVSSGYEALSNKVTTLDNSTAHYPSTSAVTTALSTQTLQAITNNGNTSTSPISVGTALTTISKLYYIGDSITAGYGLTDPTLRWSTLLAAQLRVVEVNHAVTGMTVQDGSPAGYGGSILTQLSLIPNYDSGNSYLIISLGTNDIGLQGVPGQTGYTVSGYISGMTSVLTDAASKGWPASRIMFSSPSFIGNYAYWTATTTTSNTATSIAYRDALKTFCTANNTKFLDTYAITTANGGTSLLQTDGVHYNIAGNKILATATASSLNTTTIYGDIQVTGQLAVGSIKDGPQFYSAVRITGNAVNQFVEIGHFKYTKNVSDFIDITINSTDSSFLLPIYNGDGYNAASYKYHIAVNSWFPNNTWVNVNANTITGYANGWEVYYQHAFQLQMMLVAPSFSDTRIYFRIKNLNTQQQTVYIQLTTTDYANSSYFVPTSATGSDTTNYNSIGSTTYAATSNGSVDEFYTVWPQLALNNAPVNSNGTYQLLVRNSSTTPNLKGNIETVSTLPVSMIPGVATLAGTETLSNKTFSDNPIVPTPTLGGHAVNKSYADALVTGLLDDRGSYNASSNTYPTTGGSGTAGAILKGDIWSISGSGTLGGVAVNVGDWVRCVTDTPGQTSTNWAIVEGNLGYTPENVANKTNTISQSITQYTTPKGVQDYVGIANNGAVPFWTNTALTNDQTNFFYNSTTKSLKVGGANIGIMAAWGTNQEIYVGSSQAVSGPYPFNGNGHLLLQTRPIGNDIVLATGLTTSMVSIKANIKGNGNLQIGVTDATDLGGLFSVFQPTIGYGTISTTATGTTVTGANTQFTNTFKVGDTITGNGETRTISAITNDTTLTTDAWTNTNTNIGYTLVGATRFQVKGNGAVSMGGNGYGVNILAPKALGAVQTLNIDQANGQIYIESGNNEVGTGGGGISRGFGVTALFSKYIGGGIDLNTSSSYGTIRSIINTVTVASTSATSMFYTQPNVGPGTISTTAAGTTVTGVNTSFLSTFKVGQNITANGETRAITAIASDVSMTTAAWTNANSGIGYTLVGGTRFTVKGNGDISAGGVVTLSNSTAAAANQLGALVISTGGINTRTAFICNQNNTNTGGSGNALTIGYIGATSGSVLGTYINVLNNGNGAVTGLAVAADSSGTGNVIGTNSIAEVANATSGAVTASAYAFRSIVSNSAASILTNAYGFYTQSNTNSTGSIVNNYGLYVESQTVGTTLNYGVYTAGTTPSFFGGNVNIGAVSSTFALLNVSQPSAGIGTVSTTAASPTVTGVGTQFLTSFKIGQGITISGETHLVTAIASNTSMTTAAWTGAFTNATYTVSGGARFAVNASGDTTISASLALGVASTFIPGARLHIVQALNTSADGIRVDNAAGTSGIRLWTDTSGNSRISANSTENNNIALNGGGVGTGRVLIGTTTDDGVNRLQVIGSITSTGNITTTGVLRQSVSTTGVDAAEFINTHATGFGTYLKGGNATNYALKVDDYLGNNVMTVLGNGNATFSGALNGTTLAVNGNMLTSKIVSGNFKSLALENNDLGNGSGTSIYMGFQSSGGDPYGIRLLQTGNPTQTRAGSLAIQYHTSSSGDGYTSIADFNSAGVKVTGNTVISPTDGASSTAAYNYSSLIIPDPTSSNNTGGFTFKFENPAGSASTGKAILDVSSSNAHIYNSTWFRINNTDIINLNGGGISVVIGDVEVGTTNNGFIAKSPNGTRWRLTPSDAGASVWALA